MEHLFYKFLTAQERNNLIALAYENKTNYEKLYKHVQNFAQTKFSVSEAFLHGGECINIDDNDVITQEPIREVPKQFLVTIYTNEIEHCYDIRGLVNYRNSDNMRKTNFKNPITRQEFSKENIIEMMFAAQKILIKDGENALAVALSGEEKVALNRFCTTLLNDYPTLGLNLIQNDTVRRAIDTLYQSNVDLLNDNRELDIELRGVISANTRLREIIKELEESIKELSDALRDAGNTYSNANRSLERQLDSMETQKRYLESKNLFHENERHNIFVQKLLTGVTIGFFAILLAIVNGNQQQQLQGGTYNNKFDYETIYSMEEIVKNYNKAKKEANLFGFLPLHYVSILKPNQVQFLRGKIM